MSVFFGMYKSIPNNYAKKKVQREYPNTHCSGIEKSKGLQSADTNATLCLKLSMVQRAGFEPANHYGLGPHPSAFDQAGRPLQQIADLARIYQKVR